MIARYEQSVLSGNLQVTAQKYAGLQNLPHWHMECELIYAEKGTSEVMTENTVYTLNEKQCVFIKSGALHYIRSDPDSIISVMKMDTELINSAVGSQTPICPLIKNSCGFAETFEKIRQEISDHKKYYEVICAGLASAMTAEIFRNEKTESQKSPSESSAYKELLRIISERYADITFDEAAETMCFSKPYFSKYFRRMSGMTFSEYLNVVRVSAAVKMLSQGMSAGETAFAAGFGTIRSFNRVFRSCTGYTPRELPKDFVFIGDAHETDGNGFDPTLPPTKLL